jgi:hypothetical protein
MDVKMKGENTKKYRQLVEEKGRKEKMEDIIAEAPTAMGGGTMSKTNDMGEENREDSERKMNMPEKRTGCRLDGVWIVAIAVILLGKREETKEKQSRQNMDKKQHLGANTTSHAGVHNLGRQSTDTGNEKRVSSSYALYAEGKARAMREHWENDCRSCQTAEGIVVEYMRQ